MNESAVKAMGDDKLKLIAAELITQVKKSVTIDWTLREGARAKIGSLAAAARSGCGQCFALLVCLASLALWAACGWLSPLRFGSVAPAPSARVMVKRILNKYGYPPDLQEEAVKTVLMQAELLCADWV